MQFGGLDSRRSIACLCEMPNPPHPLLDGLGFLRRNHSRLRDISREPNGDNNGSGFSMFPNGDKNLYQPGAVLYSLRVTANPFTLSRIQNSTSVLGLHSRYRPS